MSSKYQQKWRQCMRLARKTDDAVLSFGYMKMAQAWLDLEKPADHEATQGTTAAQCIMGEQAKLSARQGCA
jgi:hypothetical protein